MSALGIFLFSASSGAWPEFDLHAVDVATLVYVPPSLTVDYKRFSSMRAAGSEFGWSDNGGKARARIEGTVSNQGQHRRWQDVVGDKHHRSKLTDMQIVEIREKYAAGGTTHGKLALMYAVSKETIRGICSGALRRYAAGPTSQNHALSWRNLVDYYVVDANGERTYSEEHPCPEQLSESDRKRLARAEQKREDERYVSTGEIAAWSGSRPVEYEWGTYHPEAGRAL